MLKNHKLLVNKNKKQKQKLFPTKHNKLNNSNNHIKNQYKNHQ